MQHIEINNILGVVCKKEAIDVYFGLNMNATHRAHRTFNTRSEEDGWVK